jgi:hypothetical protein
MTPKQWMFDPNSGGLKIPPSVQADMNCPCMMMVNSQASRSGPS